MRETSYPILVVDDSGTMRAIVKDMLARLGFRHVDEAEDGRSALGLVRSKKYALIISDWHMEPMSGLDLLREVRRLGKPSGSRFIFATSERSWGSQTTAKIDGADAFIVKPFSIETLKSKIATVFG